MKIQFLTLKLKNTSNEKNIRRSKETSEDREDRHRKKAAEDKWIIKFAFRFACSMIIVFIITVLFALWVT